MAGSSGVDVGSIIGNLINTGVQIWSAKEQQGALAKAAQSIQAAPYKPVDFTKQQRDTVKGNIKNLPHIQELDDATNNFITAEMMKRAKTLIPGYSASMGAYGRAAGQLLNGQLPFDDALGIVSDRSALGDTMGTPGGGEGLTMRDLGMSRLDALKMGGGILKDMVGIAGDISPTSAYANPQSMFLTPTQTVPWAMSQNETIQQSDQGILNAAAQRAQLLAYAKNLPWNAFAAAGNTAVSTYSGGSSTGQGVPSAGGTQSLGNAGGSDFNSRFGGSYSNGMTA